jgi:molybdopterin-containing oxidoreductase family iron-sulfur binding subunit
MKTIPPACPHPDTGPQYWRSLDEVAETPEFRQFVEREFPAGAGELSDPHTRRTFVKIMASSFALAGLGLTGCRRPVETIVPFTRLPQDYVHGAAQYYATAMPTRLGAVPLVVRSMEGRPIKIEGNPDHPDSNGGTNLHAQASILDLYDVDRARRFTLGGTNIPPEGVLDQLGQISRRFAGNGGQGLAILLEPGNSPSRDRVRGQVQQKLAAAKWYTYDTSGTDVHQQAATEAYGQSVAPRFHYDKAAVIVSLDCDFIGLEEENHRNIRGFVQGRKIDDEHGKMNRLYVLEALMTLTGLNADHRLRLASSAIPQKAAELASAVLNNQPSQDKWIQECANDLKDPSRAGKVLVVAGHRQPLAVHLLAHAMNQALGAVGQTVTLHSVPERRDGSIVELAQALNAGQVDTLIIASANPVYSAPADLDWATAQKKARMVVRLGYHEDETSAASTLNIPELHYLESWGDARTGDGTYVAVQPLIAPLFGGLTQLELLARIAGLPQTNPHDIVRATFAEIKGSNTENAWRTFLHDGFVPDTASKPVNAAFKADVAGQALQTIAAAPKLDASNLEVVLHKSYSLDDGRYNNNGWLQELPDPITRITWDNVILVSPATAKALNLTPPKGGQNSPFDRANSASPFDKENLSLKAPVVKVSVNGREVTGPVWVQPGMADNVAALAFGYGRSQTGRVGVGAGFNAYPLRTSKAMHVAIGGKLSATGEAHPISCTQNHWAMEARPIIREATLPEYQKHPDFAKSMDMEEPPVTQSLYPNPLEKEKANDRIVHQWGMSIDLNSCVACAACVIACQSENNIPSVGKDQVDRNREMHWIRIDRYFTGPIEDPQVVAQPMLCQHCEAAPCENVCPVNATVHDEEGLNVMVYNRCVGTRYCSNNCPYKVRRFNYLDFNKRRLEDLKGPRYSSPLVSKTDGEWDLKRWFNNVDAPKRPEDEWELIKLLKNPDVSVRMRGVMEKCTFCVQRIEAAKITQKVKAGATDDVQVPDGTIKTACQQACPADAIVFGNIKDPNSRVSKLKKQNRTYQVLDFLYTRPRTTYLARVRNPNPKMPDYKEIPFSTQEYIDKMGDPYER